jgi:Fe-S-cluster containining protein
VPVTGADILRIERNYDVRFWEFVCRWEDPEGSIARNYAPHFHFADEPEMPFVICLSHSGSKVFPTTSKCTFLVEEPPTEENPEFPLGTAHCGIYEHRPSACRTYPTRFNESEELAVLYDLPASGRASSQHPCYSLCSRDWEPADFDPLELLPDLAVARFEMRFFHKIASIWNASPKPWGMFPRFLEVMYANRILRAPSHVEEQPEVIAFPVKKEQQDQTKRRAA